MGRGGGGRSSAVERRHRSADGEGPGGSERHQARQQPSRPSVTKRKGQLFAERRSSVITGSRGRRMQRRKTQPDGHTYLTSGGLGSEDLTAQASLPIASTHRGPTPVQTEAVCNSPWEDSLAMTQAKTGQRGVRARFRGALVRSTPDSGRRGRAHTVAAVVRGPRKIRGVGSLRAVGAGPRGYRGRFPRVAGQGS